MEKSESIAKLLSQAGIDDIEDTHEGFMCSCPLPEHEDSTPSFTINTETGLWICFGCGASGNLPMLAHKLLGISLQEAMEDWSEAEAWPELEDRVEGKAQEPILPETVLIPFRKCPSYMLERGFSKKFLKFFEVGFDETSNRVVFPIRNLVGQLVGLTRRATFDGDKPKYKHTSFEKSHHLYLGNYLFNRLAQVKGGVAVVVEGHVDALRCWQVLPHGFELPFAGAVACMGSGLSDRQAKLLSRMGATTVVLAFDHDKEGKKAEERSYEALLEMGMRNLYRLRYPKELKDPGDITVGTKTSLVEL